MLQINIYCLCICSSYALIFHSTELSESFICFKNMFLHDVHMRSYAFVVLLANGYVDTLYCY